MTVYMDGWSVAMLDTTTLLAGGVANVEAELVPLDEDSIYATPDDVLARIAARLANADRAWACNDGFCTSEAGSQLTATQLANPAQIEHFGPIYEDQEIESGVWRAIFTLPPSSDAWTPDFRTAGGWELPSHFDGTSRVSPDDRTVVLAAGLGLLFPLDSYWSHTGPGAYYYNLQRSSLNAADMVEIDRDLAQHLGNGLAGVQAKDELSGLSDSELTMLTSPTLGCGSEVACLPHVTTELVEQLVHEVFPICYEGDQLGVATVFDRIERVTYPDRAHQYGLWGTPSEDLSEFTPDSYAGLLGPTPPLVEGTQEVQRRGAHFWAASPVDGRAVLVTHAVTASHLTDDSHRMESASPEEILAEMAPDYVTVCGAETAEEPAEDTESTDT